MPADRSAAHTERRAWYVQRDHGGGWHRVCDGSSIVRADVWGAANALFVCRALAERLGAPVREQTENDVRDPMFTKEALDALG